MTRLSELVEASRRVTETSGRLEKIALLADVLARLEPDETEPAVLFLSGEARPGRLGIGFATLKKATPPSPSDTPSLTVLDVYRALGAVASAGGRGSTADRALILYRLFSRATREEQAFLTRLILGEMRQGALEGIMTEAIAKATSVPPAQVRRALMLSGDLGAVARATLAEGGAGLAGFDVRLGRAIQPMLALTAESVAEALSRLGTAAFELKLDGARVQAHKDGADVKVFTRRLNDVSAAVPEIVETVRGLPARSIILDGETLALRPNGKPQPFQTTMRRFGRRLEVARMREELPLTTFFFDCLYLNGESLIDRRTEDRFRGLCESVSGASIVTRRVTGDVSEAESFQNLALSAGHEGVMAKALDAPYEAGARGGTWLKVKMAHTLDLVVLAAEWGHGRRRGWLSNLHLAARDPSTGEWVMLGKTFKGLTDEILAWQTERLQAIETSRDRGTVYVRPELVVEIVFNEIQTSSQYPGGFALRFARVKRYRPDKSPREADTLDTVRRIFEGRRSRPSTRIDP